MIKKKLSSILIVACIVCGHRVSAQPFFEGQGPDVNPAIYFNRVEGLRPQIGIQKEIGKIGMLYGKTGYGLSRGKWVYDVGFARWVFYENRLSFGAGFHEIVDTNDGWIMGDEEASTLDFLTGTSARDYFLRSGYELFIRQRVAQYHTVDLRFAVDDYGHLKKETDWSLFRRKHQKRENWERETEADKRRTITEERINALTVTYRFEAGGGQRQVMKYSASGYAMLSAEFAGRRLNGDVTYTRSLLNADFRVPSGRDAAFGLKLFAGLSNQRLPLQKRFEFGGIGTLPGYRYKELGGDRAFLIHGEYLFGSERFKLVPFVGAGAAWRHDQRFDADLAKYNAGIGVEVGEGRDQVRVDFARPVGDGKRTAWEKHLLFLKSW